MNRNHTERSKIVSNVIYIATALLVVVLMCIALYTVAASIRGNNAESENNAVTDNSIVTDSIAPRDNSKTSEKPSINTPEPLESSPAAEAAAQPDDVSDDIPSGTPDSGSAAPVYTVPSYILPCNGTISKGYDSEIPVYSLTMNDYRVHSGIDIAVPVGTAVASCGDGTILSITDDVFMGKMITVDHGKGLVSSYMNLSEEIPQGIEVGAQVKTGQVIGGVGESALIEMADSSHLHFSMTLNGKSVNPLTYIKYDGNLGSSDLYEDEN